MDKNLFDDAIGNAPPSTVDVDAAIARGRRAARLRAVASPVAGVAAGVVLVVGAAAFTLLPGEPGGIAPAATSSPTPTPTFIPGDGETITCTSESETDEPPDAARTRLTALAADLVGARLPAGAELTPASGGRDTLGNEFGALEVFQGPSGRRPEAFPGDPVVCKEMFGYNAYADIEVDGRFANIHLALSTRDLPAERCADLPADESVSYCEAFTGDRGETVLARTEVLDDGSVQHVVWAAKPDGTSVAVTVSDSTVDDSPDLAELPMSVDQAVEIALDPGMTLYP